jgi:hypothetical protein
MSGWRCDETEPGVVAVASAAPIRAPAFHVRNVIGNAWMERCASGRAVPVVQTGQGCYARAWPRVEIGVEFDEQV